MMSCLWFPTRSPPDFNFFVLSFVNDHCAAEFETDTPVAPISMSESQSRIDFPTMPEHSAHSGRVAAHATMLRRFSDRSGPGPLSWKKSESSKPENQLLKILSTDSQLFWTSFNISTRMSSSCETCFNCGPTRI